MKNLSKILSVVLCLALALSLAICVIAEGETSFEEITTIDELTTGQYKLVVGEYNLGVLDGTWVTNAESVWTITVVEGGVTLCDANGKFIAPKGGNNNGIKEGEYTWSVTCENGAFIFLGQGADTVRLAANVQSAQNGYAGIFRGYKNTTAGSYPDSYPHAFTLYKEVVKEVVPGQPVCEHAVEDHMAIDVAPTCTEYGFTLHVCTVEGCDGSYADNYVDALGHDFGEATCMQAATCTRCGETSGELGAHNITAKNEEIIYPTCTEEGLAAYWYCGDCCTYFADAECTVKMEDQTGLNLAIAATGHNIVAKNEEYIYPTCTEEGVIAYWYCGDCCTYFANAECTEEMEDQTGLNLTVAPTGHNIVAKNEEIIYPTCTEEGLAAYWYCGDCCTYFANAECTEELEDQTGLNLAIPATGHNITSSSEGFEATETEDGMIEYYYCGDCCTYFHDAECTEEMEDQTGLNLVIPAKGTSDSPDTGDNTVVLFVVFAMVVMTGLTVMVCKKKYF